MFIFGGVVSAALTVVGAPWPIPWDAPLLAHTTGMVAGYLAAVMVILMARVPVLENQVGPDRLTRWHSRTGRLFVTLIVVHAAAAVRAWSNVRQIDSTYATVEVLEMPWLVPAAVGTAGFVVIAAVSIRAARRRVSYERWHAIHLIAYLAVALSFAHELAGPNVAGHRWVQIGWTLLYAWAFGLALRYRVLAPALSTWRHRLRVTAVIPEADGVASIVMTGHHLDELGAESGQFFRWRFLTSSTWASAHPFSLSAPPEDDRFRITVKALGRGSSLVHAVRPGTLVLAEGPSGAMTARRRTRPSVLLIAGGVGITPMRSLFETIPDHGGRLTLLYRASSSADVIFRREIEAIAWHRRAEVIWLIGSSKNPANAITAANLLRLVPDAAERDVYLCAAPALTAAVKTALSDAGLSRSRLHDENFAF